MNRKTYWSVFAVICIMVFRRAAGEELRFLLQWKRSP